MIRILVFLLLLTVSGAHAARLAEVVQGQFFWGGDYDQTIFHSIGNRAFGRIFLGR